MIKFIALVAIPLAVVALFGQYSAILAIFVGLVMLAYL